MVAVLAATEPLVSYHAARLWAIGALLSSLSSAEGS